jgi:carbon-monoxide dehydrogenase catalytic subunit
VKRLTEDIESLTGGKVALGDDPVQVARDIEDHIQKKRTELGLN